MARDTETTPQTVVSAVSETTDSVVINGLCVSGLEPAPDCSLHS